MAPDNTSSLHLTTNMLAPSILRAPSPFPPLAGTLAWRTGVLPIIRNRCRAGGRPARGPAG
eukprot:11198287-Lingulodinium_polyedra.AAC.1